MTAIELLNSILDLMLNVINVLFADQFFCILMGIMIVWLVFSLYLGAARSVR